MKSCLVTEVRFQLLEQLPGLWMLSLLMDLSPGGGEDGGSGASLEGEMSISPVVPAWFRIRRSSVGCMSSALSSRSAVTSLGDESVSVIEGWSTVLGW